MKTKRIKGGYQKAVNSGRRSGGRTVVFVLYQECREIWAGSPVVTSIENIISSDDVNDTRKNIWPLFYLLLLYRRFAFRVIIRFRNSCMTREMEN